MPKVLRILNRFIVGGPALHVVNLTHFMNPEFETLLVVGNKDHHEHSAEYLADKLGIKPIYIADMSRNINLLNDYRSYRKLKKIIKDFNPDVVHTHGAKSGAIGRMAAYSMGVPVIIHTYHGHIFHSYFGKLKTSIFLKIERFLARRSDVIIAISKLQKKELLDDFKIAKDEKFRIVPLGLDLDKFQINYAEKRDRFRAEFGLMPDEIAIGIIGRLAPIKNHPLFLRSIAFVKDHSKLKIKGFIIGDGEMKHSLEEAAKELGLKFTSEKNIDFSPYDVVFTSWRNDIDVVNAGLDIIALTSFNEGTPVSLIEAQASNKAIVATSVGGIRDIVTENETGLLSNINDTNLFMTNLLRVVEDKELRYSLGKNSYNIIKEKYNYQRLVLDIAELYHSLIKKKRN